MNEIKVLMIEPKKEPYVTEIGDDLKSMQKAVGGYIETVPLSGTAVLVCNEEGKLLRMEVSRRLVDDILLGTFFVAGYKEDEFTDLSDADIEKYTQLFKI